MLLEGRPPKEFKGMWSSPFYIKRSRSTPAILLCWAHYVASPRLRFNAGGPPTTNIHLAFAPSQFETCLPVNEVSNYLGLQNPPSTSMDDTSLEILCSSLTNVSRSNYTSGGLWKQKAPDWPCRYYVPLCLIDIFRKFTSPGTAEELYV